MYEPPLVREDAIATELAERFSEAVSMEAWQRAEEWAEAAFRRVEALTPDENGG